MQIAQLRVKPLANDLAIPHHNRSNKGIRANFPAPELRQLKRPPEMRSIRACQQSIHID
jgi:hypothetical protein